MSKPPTQEQLNAMAAANPYSPDAQLKKWVECQGKVNFDGTACDTNDGLPPNLHIPLWRLPGTPENPIAASVGTFVRTTTLSATPIAYNPKLPDGGYANRFLKAPSTVGFIGWIPSGTNMVYVVQSLEQGDCPGWAPVAKSGNYKIVTKEFIANSFYVVLDIPFSCDMLLGFPRLLPARVTPVPLTTVIAGRGLGPNPIPVCPRGYTFTMINERYAKNLGQQTCVLDQRVQDAQMRILKRTIKDLQAKYPPLPGKPQAMLPRTPVLAETYNKTYFNTQYSNTSRTTTCPAGSSMHPTPAASVKTYGEYSCYVDCGKGEIDTGVQCIKACPVGFYDLDPKTGTCYAPCPNGTVTAGTSCAVMDVAPTFDIKSTDKVIIKKEVAPIVSPPDAPFEMDGYVPWKGKYDFVGGGGRQPQPDSRCPRPAQILAPAPAGPYKCYPQCKEGETILYDRQVLGGLSKDKPYLASINDLAYHITCRKCPDGTYNAKGDSSKCFPKCPKGQLDLGTICVIKGGNTAGEKYMGVPNFLRPSNLLGAKVSKFTDYVKDTIEGMEPDWTGSISNKTICDWFYGFFIFNAIFVVAIVVILFTEMKGGLAARMLQVLPTAIVGAINLLFWYLMCDRALLK